MPAVKQSETASASFLKKRSKKLLFAAGLGEQLPQHPGPKVFCFFFSKKKRFLPS
jgi:hypothetical protein